MSQLVRWELKKMFLNKGYYALGLVFLILVTCTFPNNILLPWISVAFVCGGIYLIVFPFYNVLSMFRQPDTLFEWERRESVKKQLLAKLFINIVIAIYFQLIYQTTNLVFDYLWPEFQIRFFYEATRPVLQVIVEMAVFYPLVFLCIYYQLKKVMKAHQGIFSVIVCNVIYGAFQSGTLDTWNMVLLEVIISILLIIQLGKWLEVKKKPYHSY